MKISFLGLSCFLIETLTGDSILLEPFNDQPEYQLGARLPKKLTADLVFSSHKDPDHYNPLIIPRKNDLSSQYFRKDVIGNEFNGDEFKINIFEIDGYAVAHFADQSVLLSEKQISEIGPIDIAFYSPPKVDGNKVPQALEVVQKNLEKVNPKIVIWSHFITPDGWQNNKGEDLRTFFRNYLGETAKTNINYNGSDSFIELCYILENALALNNKLNGKVIKESSIEVAEVPKEMTSILFSKMLQ